MKIIIVVIVAIVFFISKQDDLLLMTCPIFQFNDLFIYLNQFHVEQY